MTGESEAEYVVLINDEDQYSIWPGELDVPAGWSIVGAPGTRAECLAYVESVWVDMRPRSLRDRTEAGSTL